MRTNTAKKQNKKAATVVSTPVVASPVVEVINLQSAALKPAVIKMNSGDWTGSLRQLNARDNSEYAVCLIGNINPFIKTGYVQMRADGKVSLMKKNPATGMIEKVIETKLDMIKVLVGAKFTRNEAK